jgi:hypothetical protein
MKRPVSVDMSSLYFTSSSICAPALLSLKAIKAMVCVVRADANPIRPGDLFS